MIAVFCCMLFLMEEPVITRSGGEHLSLTLPAAVLEDPDLHRRLFSGLTTTMEFETEIRVDHNSQKIVQHCILIIRYDLWEEQLRVRTVRGRTTHPPRAFPSLNAWIQWLQSNPITLATVHNLDARQDWRIKARLRIIPFSKSEADQSRDWFSQVLEVEDGAGGEKSRSRVRRIQTERESNGVFQVLMTTGIDRDPVRTYRWRWSLPGEKP